MDTAQKTFLAVQAELSKELNELKNDQYKKRERPKAGLSS